MIGPPRPQLDPRHEQDRQEQGNQEQSQGQAQDQAQGDEVEDEDEIEALSEKGIPVSQRISLPRSQRAVTSVSIDPKGHRFAVGTLDGRIRMFDFHGMNVSLGCFRTVQPIQGHPIRKIRYNCDGSALLSCQGNCQLNLVDRDGFKALKTVRGYAFVLDPAKTKGHSYAINDFSTHPSSPHQFLSCSEDCTIRFWDTHQKLQLIEQQMSHVKWARCLDSASKPVRVESVTYLNKAGSAVMAACKDGSLQMFDSKAMLHRPKMLVRRAHRQDGYSALVAHPDQIRVFSRGKDRTLKVWDIRKFKDPLFVEYNLPNNHPESKLSFSPDSKFLLVGTSKDQEEGPGGLLFYQLGEYKRVGKVGFGDTSVTDCCWNGRISQILVGLSSGQAQFCFDSGRSTGGILASQLHIVPQKRVQDQIEYKPVYLPNALQSMRQKMTNNFKRQINKQRKEDPSRPEIPIFGPGRHGRLGQVTTVVQSLIKVVNPDPIQQSNPQRELQALQKAARASGFEQAYRQTQPRKIFIGQEQGEHRVAEYLRGRGRICGQCGLKICTCVRKYVMQSGE